MRKFKFVFTILMLMFSSLYVVNANAAVESDPITLLQYIADNMISQLKTHQATLKSKPEIVYNLARQYIVPHADLDEMSKRVLPPTVFNNATAEQRQRFKQEFTTTVIRTYASSLNAYRDQTVQFYPVRGGYGKSVQVKSVIKSSESDPISVSYRLQQVGGKWKLYDMSVEGIDMLDSFRSQFAEILAQGNMDTLLKRLSQHNNR